MREILAFLSMVAIFISGGFLVYAGIYNEPSYVLTNAVILLSCLVLLIILCVTDNSVHDTHFIRYDY